MSVYQLPNVKRGERTVLSPVTSSVVLGNGVSRQIFNPYDLHTIGKVYGCNALYRDFWPDVLVATDPGITREIEDSDFPSYRTFYTRTPSHSASRRIPKNYGYSSGPIAVTLAAMSGDKHVYMLGFDLSGVDSRFNNVYAGTPHYKAANSDPTYYGNWVKQIQSIAKEFRDTIFYRVGDDLLMPLEWQSQSNIKSMLSAEFSSKLEG